ncbi:hypothetical protein ACI65C_007903 [Semiaphis heraclei]
MIILFIAFDASRSERCGGPFAIIVMNDNTSSTTPRSRVPALPPPGNTSDAAAACGPRRIRSTRQLLACARTLSCPAYVQPRTSSLAHYAFPLSLPYNIMYLYRI